ncbi:FAD-binding oxidoreductase [Candidatus Binatia bacterium]|nr:FAD-binding oxidoreductase [Candidatus Binatia bacterium]
MRTLDVDVNRSSWALDLPPYEPSPALAGTTSADVVVVGGGITGMSAAWHLARRCPDRRIVLLEARAIGNGASGRNGGQVLNWLNGVAHDTPDDARRDFAFTQQGVQLIEDIARAHAAPATFTRNGCLELCTDARRAEAAHAATEQLASYGIPVRWLSRADVRVPGVHGATLDPTAGRVDMLALLRAWKPALVAAGVAIHEGTHVRRIDDGSPLRVVTDAGEVRAPALVLATNAYTPSLGFFRDRLLPLHAHALATPVLPPDLWRALGIGGHDGFSDDLDRIAYGCRTESGRLVFGGGSNAAYAYRYGGAPVFDVSPAARARAFAAVRATMNRYFPALASLEPAACWSGLLDITFDRAPSIGTTGSRRNVYYALGYSGHGLALGMQAGRVIADLYVGDRDAWRGFPFCERRMPRIPPEPLRWVGYQAYTRLTGRSPRR